MARIKNESRVIFEAEGFLDISESGITLTNDDGEIIDISEILEKAEGKNTKIGITTITQLEVPVIKE